MSCLEKFRALPIRGVLTVIGAFLLHVSIGITYIFANLMPYITAYLRLRTSSEDTTYTEIIWISTSNAIFGFFFTPLIGIAELYLSTKTIIIFSCCVSTLGILTSYFSIKGSLISLAVTYGVVFGIGRAVTYPLAFKAGMKWFPSSRGFVTGFIVTGYGLSSFIFNIVVTEFVNPNNYTPDTVVGEDKYFSQEDLLDNVPYCFLIIGGSMAALQIVAILLISEPPKIQTDSELKSKESESVKKEKDVTTNTKQNNISLEDTPSMTPKEALQCKLFYIIWFYALFFGIGFGYTTNFYKTYGQTFIFDDHYLGTVASISSIFNAAGRIVWGLIADRIGLEKTLIVVSTIFSCFLSTLLITEFVGKEMFFAWLCVIYSAFPGLFTVTPALVMNIYGPKYFLIIFGMQLSEAVLSGIITVVSATTLKPLIGWHGLFYFASAAIALAFFMSLILDVESQKFKISRAKKQKELKTLQNSATSVNTDKSIPWKDFDNPSFTDINLTVEQHDSSTHL